MCFGETKIRNPNGCTFSKVTPSMAESLPCPQTPAMATLPSRKDTSHSFRIDSTTFWMHQTISAIPATIWGLVKNDTTMEFFARRPFVHSRSTLEDSKITDELKRSRWKCGSPTPKGLRRTPKSDRQPPNIILFTKLETRAKRIDKVTHFQ